MPAEPARRRLRILHLVEMYPPDYGGGTAVTTRDVCRFLATRGHEVMVLCVTARDGAPYAVASEQIEGVRVSRINLPYFREVDPHGEQLGLRHWLSHQRRVARLVTGVLETLRPNIIDYHTGLVSLGEACLHAVIRSGTPVVATLHDAWLICQRLQLLRSPPAAACPGPKPLRCLECVFSNYEQSRLLADLKLPWRLLRLGPRRLYSMLIRPLARQGLTGAFARSRFLEEAHRPHLDGALVRHIALGVDHRGLDSVDVERPRSPFRFGFMGGAIPNKGASLLLDAARTLKAEGLSFRVTLWGPEGDATRDCVYRRDLADRIEVRGKFAAEDRWRVYADFDMAVVATTSVEPFGRVPLEAAAAGIPCIAPAVGGLVESIRHDVDGLLFAFRDAGALAKQMRRILQEPSLYERLRRALPPVPATETAVGELEDFYYEILRRTPRAKGREHAAPRV